VQQQVLVLALEQVLVLEQQQLQVQQKFVQHLDNSS
jgi:hypothetical protein